LSDRSNEDKQQNHYSINNYKLFTDPQWEHSLDKIFSAAFFGDQKSYQFFKDLLDRDRKYHNLASKQSHKFFFGKISNCNQEKLWWMGTNQWQINIPKSEALQSTIYHAFSSQKNTLGNKNKILKIAQSPEVNQRISILPDFVKETNLLAVKFNKSNDYLSSDVHTLADSYALSVISNYQKRQLATVDPQHLRIIEDILPTANNQWKFALGSSQLVYYNTESKAVHGLVQVKPSLQENDFYFH
jgi:hypothetical protein